MIPMRTNICLDKFPNILFGSLTKKFGKKESKIRHRIGFLKFTLLTQMTPKDLKSAFYY